eukprot:Skav232805  [mRNA]  locus=scaffold614:431249:441390:- [translate_table: standard]
MLNPRKRFSIQVVPGHEEADELAEEPASNVKSNGKSSAKENSTGSEGSPVRTPRALKATQSETKNDISTLISRKSFANVQFHRYSVFASLFDLRAAVVIHLCSCLLSVVSVLEVQDGNTQAWAADELLHSGPKHPQGIERLSWYYTATTVTSIGYGDISPLNANERRQHAKMGWRPRHRGVASAPGLITWTRYQVLLSRIQAWTHRNQLDQKLLWAELDEEQSGAATRRSKVPNVFFLHIS